MSECSCSPNRAIRCTVQQCAHHSKSGDYCALSSVQIGTHEKNPTGVRCTDCESFCL